MNGLRFRKAGYLAAAGLICWSILTAMAGGQVVPLEQLPQPKAVEIGFAAGTEKPLLIEAGVSKPATDLPGFLKAATSAGGTVQSGEPDGWTVEDSAAFGVGRIDLLLDRGQILGELAMVVAMEFSEDADISVQLYDESGRVLAMDVFGNAAKNAKTAGTDTFVVPLTRYPEAATISLRRLQGKLVIRRIALVPVLAELIADPEYEKQLAERLGEVLSPLHKVFQSTTGGENISAGDAGFKDIDADLHLVTPMELVNRIGAAALAEVGYPKYRALGLAPLPDLKVYSSGTMWTFINTASRNLALQANREPFSVSNYSSNGVEAKLHAEPGILGFTSAPMASSEKERFFKARGYPLIEVQIARDAMEVLVNSSNPLQEITIPQLDAIYGKELRAGAANTITNWKQLGLPGGEIKLWGGNEGWGTTRSFQKMVLQGGPYRDGIEAQDVAHASGVEAKVGEDPNGIGYVSLRPRGPKVRPLALAENSGMTAYTASAESVYSGKYPLQRMMYAYIPERSLSADSATTREMLNLLLSSEGQAMIARTGTLPLTAGEVAALRRELGLP